ncbi:hypothetical protein AK812_SmicGene43238 [Symbiodinium microadriaticum]|uniref:Uncharacterized protein n=1 Tax=Symbiodinium microadriaticum TaxID=2951 RepID=A0A1Q9C1I7_SYMMI|nr:hypothetical protein AK812_SmicGene43238 [Symbiodinium microadriaticum]
MAALHGIFFPESARPRCPFVKSTSPSCAPCRRLAVDSPSRGPKGPILGSTEPLGRNWPEEVEEGKDGDTGAMQAALAAQGQLGSITNVVREMDKMSAYVCSIYPNLRDVLEWCEEREKSISTTELTDAFGEGADEIDRVPNLFEKSTELSSALQMVTAKYDPATAARKRSMLKSVINPQKQKLDHLPQAIEEWLEAIASYEKRKNASRNRTKIPEEIKTAALESMLPQDLEAHVQLNLSKFAWFDLLEEVTRYLEHRAGKTLKAFSTTRAAGKDSAGDPMDVSSVGKGKDPKGSKGPKGSPKRTKVSKGKSKKGKGKGKGKYTNSLEEAAGDNQEEWSEEAGQDETSWEQGEWAEDQGWEDCVEEPEWKGGNGLLIGGLEEERKGRKAAPKVVAGGLDQSTHDARPGRKEDTAKVDAMETVVVDNRPECGHQFGGTDGKGKGKGEKRKATAAPEEDEDDEDEEDEEDDSWEDWKSPEGGPPGGRAAIASVAVSLATTNAVSASGGREHGPQDQRVEVNFDSGAAVTVVPMKYGRGTEKPREEMKFKTASGQNIPDYGPIRLKGTTSSGNSATLCGRLADVHRVLGSASDICRSHYAVLGEGGGYLIPKGNEFGKDFDARMKWLLRKHKGNPKSATKLHVRRGVYVFDLACSPFTGQLEA